MRSSKPYKPAQDGSDAAQFMKAMQDPDIIERVRVTIQNAHVFKLPPRQTVSVGWRGADWKDKVWQGTVKVVERADMTAVLLVDRTSGSIFAVCPVKEGAVDRCIDSSRYFVLRIENANGRHGFIGIAFNERNDAFDFNTALEDSRREREAESNPLPAYTGPSKDYSLKAGEKIHVSIPKASLSGDFDSPTTNENAENTDVWGEDNATTKKKSVKGKGKGPAKAAGGFLKPSSKDTPSRGPNPSENKGFLDGLSTSPFTLGSSPFFWNWWRYKIATQEVMLENGDKGVDSMVHSGVMLSWSSHWDSVVWKIAESFVD